MTDTSTEALRKLQGEITPGPWCVADDTVVWTVVNDPVETTYDIGYPVADVRLWQVPYGRARWPEGQPEANARLIAAAPDLLSEVLRLREQAEAMAAALRKAEAALADIGDAEREPGDDLEWCEQRAAEALPAVRAALSAYREDR